mmetsp:Transcript_7989/g.16691  ORF Transcript_7989/g.16691 Transcript_7989/m.16691 type:complete len:378 (+) Transcript_7989:679-1812(+)
MSALRDLRVVANSNHLRMHLAHTDSFILATNLAPILNLLSSASSSMMSSWTRALQVENPTPCIPPSVLPRKPLSHFLSPTWAFQLLKPFPSIWLRKRRRNLSMVMASFFSLLTVSAQVVNPAAKSAFMSLLKNFATIILSLFFSSTSLLHMLKHIDRPLFFHFSTNLPIFTLSSISLDAQPLQAEKQLVRHLLCHICTILLAALMPISSPLLVRSSSLASISAILSDCCLMTWSRASSASRTSSQPLLLHSSLHLANDSLSARVSLPTMSLLTSLLTLFLLSAKSTQHNRTLTTERILTLTPHLAKICSLRRSARTKASHVAKPAARCFLRILLRVLTAFLSLSLISSSLSSIVQFSQACHTLPQTILPNTRFASFR